LLPIEISVYIAIAAALFFDFVNGFHDSANSIATVVGTRVLRPLYAVGIAAVANFAGPFIFGTAVAVTVGKGIIQPSFSTVDVIFAGLVGAIIWDLVTWYFGLPSSSSHALIGGLIGSALIAGGTSALVFQELKKLFCLYRCRLVWVLAVRLELQLQLCIFSETKQHPVLTGFSVDFKFFLQSSFH
jgi:inorganic phosphate transporter, PiT family